MYSAYRLSACDGVIYPDSQVTAALLVAVEAIVADEAVVAVLLALEAEPWDEAALTAALVSPLIRTPLAAPATAVALVIALTVAAAVAVPVAIVALPPPLPLPPTFRKDTVARAGGTLSNAAADGR